MAHCLVGALRIEVGTGKELKDKDGWNWYGFWSVQQQELISSDRWNVMENGRTGSFSTEKEASDEAKRIGVERARQMLSGNDFDPTDWIP